ncbi:Hypothetical predicted protein, partial [Paramuricea clavata]
MDDFVKFSEPSLPPQEEFYSSLTDEGITDEDYEHAKKVWKSFDMKSMREYHDLYLKVDVLLLADIMERFREICMENYELDPAWYYTSPGLAWDACLKMTQRKVNKLVPNLNDKKKIDRDKNSSRPDVFGKGMDTMENVRDRINTYIPSIWHISKTLIDRRSFQRHYIRQRRRRQTNELEDLRKSEEPQNSRLICKTLQIPYKSYKSILESDTRSRVTLGEIQTIAFRDSLDPLITRWKYMLPGVLPAIDNVKDEGLRQLSGEERKEGHRVTRKHLRFVDLLHRDFLSNIDQFGLIFLNLGLWMDFVNFSFSKYVLEPRKLVRDFLRIFSFTVPNKNLKENIPGVTREKVKKWLQTQNTLQMDFNLHRNFKS